MFSQSRLILLGAAIVLTASAIAQGQPPVAGQGAPPAGSSAGAPQGTPPPSNPGGLQQPEQQMDPYITDKEFVRNVSESSATEVQIGKLAGEKSSSDAVKELGKQMVQAHTRNNQELKQAAAALKVQVSDEPRKARKAEEKLAKLSGTEFDRAYAKMAADEQKQTVKQFEREAKSGKVQGVKDFASRNLSAEQERQKQAEALASTGVTAGQK